MNPITQLNFWVIHRMDVECAFDKARRLTAFVFRTTPFTPQNLILGWLGVHKLLYCLRNLKRYLFCSLGESLFDHVAETVELMRADMLQSQVVWPQLARGVLSSLFKVKRSRSNLFEIGVQFTCELLNYVKSVEPALSFLRIYPCWLVKYQESSF